MKHPIAADPRDARITDLQRKVEFMAAELMFARAATRMSEESRNQLFEENRLLRSRLGNAGITRAIIAAELYGRDGAVYRTIHGDQECSRS